MSSAETGSIKIHNPLFAKCLLCLKTDEDVHIIKGKCDCQINSHYSCYEEYVDKNRETGLCPLCKTRKEAEENQCVAWCFCCFLLVGLIN